MDLADTAVAEIARRVVDDEDAVLGRWAVEPLGGGVTEDVGLSGGLRRVTGVVGCRGRDESWSSVVKTLRRGPVQIGELSPDRHDERSGDYWRREADVYASGILDDLPDALVAPRCYRIDDDGRGEVVLWLEDVPDQGPRVWPLRRLGLAARHLGRFNGRYLAGADVPQHPWLTRGRVREWLDLGGPWLGTPMREGRRAGLLATWLTDAVLDRMDELWVARAGLLAALDGLPETLCHHDAHRRNLGSRRGADGDERTLALDWQLLGTGHLGEEVAALVAVSLQLLDVPVGEAEVFERHVFAGYVGGLEDAGFDADPDDVRLGFCIAASLFMGLGGAGIWFAGLRDPANEHLVERVTGHPLDEVAPQWSGLQDHLMDLADEARRMLGSHD